MKRIAEEEDEKSPFKLLEQDITKFLTAILIGTTTCTIYAAGLGMLQCVAECCRVLQCVAAILIGTLSCTIYAAGLGMLQCVAVCCRVLQCIAVYCSVLRPFDRHHILTS